MRIPHSFSTVLFLKHRRSHAKYASFMRQVNGWGFKRIVSGNDHNSYYHELFLRDYPQLCLKMKRIRKGDKLSEAVEKSGEEPKEVTEENQSQGDTETKDGDDRKEDAEEDANEEEAPPSSAANAILSSNANAVQSTNAPQSGQPVGLSAMAGTAGTNNSSANNINMGNNLSALGLQGAVAQGMNSQNLAALSGMAAQFQQAQQIAQPQPTPAPTGAIPGLDGAALMKLQEALQGGGGNLLQQPQPQQQAQQQMPAGLAGLNMGNLGGLLQGPFSGTLAAQLQAATQAPQPNNNNGSTATNNGIAAPGNAPSVNANAQSQLQQMVAQLQQQQQNANNNNSQEKDAV